MRGSMWTFLSFCYGFLNSPRLIINRELNNWVLVPCMFKSNQVKSLLLSHHHSTCTFVSTELHMYNLHIDSIYLQTYTEDNVQNTHTYTQYTQCTIRHTYSYQYTLYKVCTLSTLCTHIHTICEGAADFT